MKNIIEKISGIFNLANRGNAAINTQQQIECNYANNYYGDQQCQLKRLEQ